MSKKSVVVSCPIDTYSGYGARSRDFVKALLELDEYNVKVLSQRWGNCRFGYLRDHNEDFLESMVVPQMTAQPDIWIMITVPNEFQKVGKFNIGLTAGIETTVCHQDWITGCNRMDLVLTSSEFGKEVFEKTKYDLKNNKTGQIQESITLKTKMDVLFEGADITKYLPKSDKGEVSKELDKIKESFCFLNVGHWMQGDFGHDRKNIGYTVKSFLETFKNKKNAPALILKTQQVGTSIMDREEILRRIDNLRSQVRGTLPNIYLFHGEVSDSEMNELYNHPKVKAMVSHTKGEGFGRPLLEFALVNKPIIASGWSGHTDFLDKDHAILLGGKLENVHKSAQVKNMILPNAQWFTPEDGQVGFAYKDVFKKYKHYKNLAKRLGYKVRTKFSWEAMVHKLDDILKENLPEFPEQVELTLPKLELPKLEKL